MSISKDKKMYLNTFIISLIISTFTTLFPSLILGQARVESDNFRIEFPNLNSGAGLPTSTNYKLDSTIGQTAPGLYSSTGYKLKAGFQYIHSIIPFSFSISDIRVDFGSIIPSTFFTHQSTITVSSGGAGGYQVKASENHPLQNFSGNIIPDTTCDNSLCNQDQAQQWTQTNKYGFGFNMTGDDIPSDFINSNYFRQFSDKSLGETESTIMSATNVGKSRQATITYKINISPIQEPGNYQNIITFFALPTY
ncbi:MAG: hypothetical protein NC913_03795 [Candidatus Omnitrophica bacterium]|nr:hypothetical protein [Candidatus Omnitrophota bacterium]